MSAEISKENVTDHVDSANGAGHDDYEMRSFSRFGGTDADEHDMHILGRVQELNVSQDASQPATDLAPAARGFTNDAALMMFSSACRETFASSRHWVLHAP